MASLQAAYPSELFKMPLLPRFAQIFAFVLVTAVPMSQAQETKPVQSLPKIEARLAEFQEKFKAAAEQGTEMTFKEGATTLDNSYCGALERSLNAATQTGKLEEALSLRAEIQRVDKKGAMPSETDDAAPDSHVPDSLRSLRKTYRSAFTKLEADRERGLQPLYEKYDQALAFYEADLTRAGDLDGAVRVKSVREEIASRRGSIATVPASQTPVAVSVGAGGIGLVNSLGMKFVPVPGTRILMCIHETRRKDYEAYAAETPSIDESWKNASDRGVPVGAGANDPVVNMSWEDAKAFCEWLTKKEKRTYRLPTDNEWSYAVGIGARETKGLTPEKLEQKLKDDFPWGKQWPPPPRAGNFADQTLKKQVPESATIEGYEDGYATTAPVMSFSPNTLGIYDLSGNVWEWCEDWLNAQHEGRVVRGGGWLDQVKGNLLSSRRVHFTPETRRYYVGFRCVTEAK